MPDDWSRSAAVKLQRAVDAAEALRSQEIVNVLTDARLASRRRWPHTRLRPFGNIDHPNTPTAIVLAALVIVGFPLLSIRRLRPMDVP